MNRVNHFEIHAKDQDRLQKFYEAVFGWTFQNLGEAMGGYRLIMTGPRTPDPENIESWGINGGMNSVPDHAPVAGASTNAFVSIVCVDSAVASVEKIKAAGGTIVEDVMDMPTVGQLAYAKDPEGNMFGIIQPVMPPFDPSKL